MIEMYCDHCDNDVEDDIPGGVRLKIGRKEYVFHLCLSCQKQLLANVKQFVNDAWKEMG